MFLEVTCTIAQPEEDYASYVLRNGSAKAINDTTFYYGSIIELQCEPGYYVKGVMSIYCAGSDQWSAEGLGTCESKSYVSDKIKLLSFYLAFLSKYHCTSL